MVNTIDALKADMPGPAMTALVTDILAATLKSLGLLNEDRPRLAPHQEQWLSRSIAYLREQNALDGDVRPLADLWSEWEMQRPSWPADPSLDAGLKALAGILSGNQSAAGAVSPDPFSQHAAYFGDVLAEALGASIDQQLQADPERTFCILEIGAGPGAATANLLPVVQRYPVREYRYTDPSSARVAEAGQHFQFPALTTGVFDVSKPLDPQSIEANHYDFVIAANGLHSTPSIRQALRNAKAALKNQGILILREISAWSVFDHLAFGLSEQWWQYDDAPFRVSGSPALAPETWREILASEGFEAIQFPAEPAHEVGQLIVTAASNGWTRQRIVKPAVRPATVAAAPQPAVPVVAAPPPPPASPSAASAAPTEQRITDYTRQIVTAKLSDALRMDAATIRDDASFADYGVDSIIGVNLVRTINEALQIELEAMSLFEYSTVDALTQFILQNWRERIAAQMPKIETAPDSQVPAPLVAATPAAVAVRAERQFTGSSRFAEARSSFDSADARESRTNGAHPIAIIGMSGRFAESESLDDFWQHLREGNELVQEVSRWTADDCVMAGAEGHGHCSHGSFIDSIDRFDPSFFGISSQEATYMDPQQRLFLEESWHALEDAGYGGKSVQEKQCGVYVGCGSSQYDKLSTDDTPASAFWGNSQSVIPARISYCLNLQGPAIAVDTACSSSLVAIHLACQGLWSGEMEMALAGGVFLQPTPGFYQVANRAGMLSVDGKTRSFEAGANGFVPGEGVGVVVLKRLSDALADGDHIHGVIAGTGVNQDGKSNGLTAPNGRAQERLERSVYDRFHINPETIQFVEAHGTGTLFGDSIEYKALSQAFREYTQKKQFCALGSVKTNIGHTSTAAGVASVLKVLLSLKHREIPPSPHFEKTNPAIDLAAGPFYINTARKEWGTEAGEPRRAAVSSFGFSGTNAHLVIEEAPLHQRPVVERPGYLVVLSARSSGQLKQQAQNLVAHLERTAGVAMTDLSFTLFTGRMQHNHRLACVARNPNDLARLLDQWLATGATSEVYTGAISDGKVREQVSLKKFGNYCIEQCADAADAASYLENLAAVAELYVQGYALDYPSLFPREARRIPLPTYPFARERYWIGAEPVEAEAEEQVLPQPADDAGPAAASAGDLRGFVQAELSQMVMDFLNLRAGDVAPDRVLVDLGFDSIGLTNFAAAINQKYELDLTPVLFFEYPSVSELARYLSEERGSEVGRHYRASASVPVVRPPASPKPARKPAAAKKKASGAFSAERRFVNEPIAIVGIAGVMPQSEDLDALWENLKDGKDLVSVIPEDRWHWEDYYGDPFKEVNKSNSKWGGFMKEIDRFDPLFFGISPREAQMMDPQQRIFLETVWSAIEDSGQKVSDLAGTKTGLFVGVGSNDYLDLMRNQAVVLDGYTASGNSHAVLANRVSFLLNLRGPSAPIDTACSSSLVALHRAIESIHTRSSDMAIVGGVQVIMSPGGYISFGMAGMLSGDGKCKAFDKKANGYVRGEGCGAILLKPLSRAEADGNHIYAVVKSTSENHGGRVTTMIAPNSAAQASLLIEAYEKAEIDPATVGYIECHGTGTSLGDPIEIQALSRAFSELYERRHQVPAEAPHCGLGTIKTNIGHLETAAGIAGLLKVLLAMKHKQLPANVHFEELNPYINLKGTPFYIVDHLQPWEVAAGVPRRAGVSSFGFGGANAHAVLEEYLAPRRKPAVSLNEPQLIVLSAKNEERLRAYVQSMHSYLSKQDVALADLAYTLQIGRDEMPERAAFVVSTHEELREKFAQFLNGDAQTEGCFRATASNAGPNADAAVQAAIENKDLSTLAELWVSGARVEWMLLHHGSAPRRVSAPTYPFARERHWIPGAEKVRRAAAPTAAPEELKTTLQTFAPVWNAAVIDSTRRIAVPEGVRVLLIGGDHASLDWARRTYAEAELVDDGAIGDRSFDQLLWIAPESLAGESIAAQQENGVLAVFRAIKDLLRAGYASKNLQWTIVTRNTQQVTGHEAIAPVHAGIGGLVGSLAKEYPHWSVRLLDVDSLDNVTAQECLSLPWDQQGNGLAHREGTWFQQGLEPMAIVPQAKPRYRQGGVYVVVGGAGGIGEVWTRFMIENYDANVVWIGRRPCNASIETKLRELGALGNAPLYIEADATNPEALAHARNTILETHPAIHGVVHSALVLHDQSIASLEEATFRASLAAKVDVTVNLDRIFGTGDLDFMLFFSSIVSFVRAAGQSSYSAGCVFKDSFAQLLRQQRPYPVKVMNWGYWGSVGVAANESHRQNMARIGLGSIEAEEGMAALEALMSSDVPQVALIKTISKATSVVGETPSRIRAAAGRSDGTVDGYVRRIIIETLCEELRVEATVIRNDVPLSDYGVDSIVGVNLVRGISEALQIALEPSALFDYRTVDQLTGYILENWQQQIAASIPQEPVASTAPEVSGDQLLDEIAWQDAPLADSYEVLTF
jgi:acyl transferase domain-containing protein/SAM-dependent methyltransferase